MNSDILFSIWFQSYTFLINHRREDNNIAIQVFTKFGPLAFLPLSGTKTSIVFSYKGVKIDDKKIVDIFKKYNSFYAFTKINKIEKKLPDINSDQFRQEINLNLKNEFKFNYNKKLIEDK